MKGHALGFYKLECPSKPTPKGTAWQSQSLGPIIQDQMPTWGNSRPHILTEKSSYSEGPSETKKTSTPWKENQRGGKTSLPYSYWWSPVVQSSSSLVHAAIRVHVNQHTPYGRISYMYIYGGELCYMILFVFIYLFIITINIEYLEYQVKSRFRLLVKRQTAYITMINKCHSTTIRYLEVNLVHMYLFNF